MDFGQNVAPMNLVTIELRITRPNPQQTLIQLLRSGHGDDMIEQRADEIEDFIFKLYNNKRNKSEEQ
jgi:hypothetical protein